MRVSIPRLTDVLPSSCRVHLSTGGGLEPSRLAFTPRIHWFPGVGSFRNLIQRHCFSSSFSCLMISSISSLSSCVPCLQMSLNACEAVYAHLLRMSAIWLFFPGTYPTVRSNLEKIWCHLDLRPSGPLGVSRTSLAHDSKHLWSVRTRTGWLPIQLSHFCNARIITYVS